jgi:Xaa-Pro dipeptidase
MQSYMHPLIARRDHKAIQLRLQGLMKKHGLDALIIVKPENIAYATGYSSITGYWLGVPPGAQALAVVPANGNMQLIVGLMERDDAKSQVAPEIEVSNLPGFVFVDDGTPESRQTPAGTLDPLGGFRNAIKMALDSAPNANIGTEKGVLIPGQMAALQEMVSAASQADCGPLLWESRLIKTPWEIEMLKLAATTSERAQARVCRELKPGMNAMVINKLFNVAYYEESEDLSV